MVSAVLLGCSTNVLPGVASAEPEPMTRADYLAEQLRRDPVFITDQAPRALPPDTAARIKRAVARLGVPTYVVVALPYVTEAPESKPHLLIPLLHDRLGTAGVYVVVSPDLGSGDARRYGGGSLPVEDAMAAANLEVPFDVDAATHIERFVDIALSGQATQRHANPRKMPRPGDPEADARRARAAARERAERIETAAFAAGTAVVGVPLLGFLIRRRRARVMGRSSAPASRRSRRSRR